ncbi:hypothetical protein C8A05DRAFT_35992 [Staphylotrichum tortipilum]|uniref:Uncharacterized protein n=1 Tax=Staphylotrichum tortipilum TaxID=2831512 RepID=A0AAN6RRK2_9PEZI|nr:hypothetical protein C8A05DRAFT_35992 [Staphylotrichum longicolle]
MKRIVLPTTEDGTQSNTQAPSSPAETAAAERPRLRQKQQQPTVSPELMDILVPSLRVGVAAGTCGIFSGMTFGIIRSAPLGLFAIVSGGQWFTMGSTYTAARLTGLKYFASEEPTSREKVKVSAVAGGVAATFAGALRGRANILPGIFVWSLVGAGGQAVVNRWDARAERAANAPPKEEKPDSWWRKLIPLTRITEEDYIRILEERLLRAEADIALADDKIKELTELKRKQEKEAAVAQTDNPAASSEA